MKAIKKIDIHAHATGFPKSAPIQARGYPWIDAEGVLGFYDKLNIEKGVLLPLNSPEYHMIQVTTGECMDMAERYAGRFLWFCGVDPRMAGNDPKADLSSLLLHYKALGAKGVGELSAQLYADDPFVDNLFYHSAACDMPVTIHIGPQFGGCYGIVDELGLPRLESMLKKHKNLKILGHSQPFWAEMGDEITEETRNAYPSGKVKEGRLPYLMRKYENLYCDLSAGSGANALMRDPEYAQKFIEEFSDRLLYGCDICQGFNTHPFVFDEFLNGMRESGGISEENYYKLVRGNAIKLLGLEADHE